MLHVSIIWHSLESNLVEQRRFIIPILANDDYVHYRKLNLTSDLGRSTNGQTGQNMLFHLVKFKPHFLLLIRDLLLTLSL